MFSLRTLLGLPIAAAITIALFSLMQYLVTAEEPVIDEAADTGEITLTREIRDEEPKLDDWKPIPPVKETPPPVTPIDISIDISDIKTGDGPMIDIGPQGEVIFVPPPNRTATPLVRIPPQYPQRAATKGVEGWVLVGFDITPAGRVENAVVVDADPAAIFNRSALRAIAKWKYKPKMVDGKPVAQYGMQQLISYELEKVAQQ